MRYLNEIRNDGKSEDKREGATKLTGYIYNVNQKNRLQRSRRLRLKVLLRVQCRNEDGW